MNKLKMQTPNMADENFKKLQELFPEAVTEVEENGQIVRAIDKDVLQQLISNEVVEGQKERYQFTWPGKHEAMLLAGTPTNKTLRPIKGENPIDDACFDTTQNLYIEGDNLEVLKIMQEQYLGKIKMIYIDPPYNTGNDFIYKDKFDVAKHEYIFDNGERDEDENRLVKNLESNGRFHSDWLSMMYPRLKIARNLLSDDGAIFVSIGDDEEANLIKICDEILGEKIFIASICHKHRASVSNDRIISENHNHLVFYAKNIEILFSKQKQIGEDPILEGFNLKDEKGEYRLTPVDGPGGAKKGNPHYEFLGVTGYWRYSKETMQEKYEKGLIIRTPNGLQQKYYKSQAELSRRTVTTWWDDDFLTSSATKHLSDLMNCKTFDNPKSINLLLRCLKMIVKFSSDAIILDFFSGSATTAHAVMQLNAEDGGNRKFIMVQLPEPCDEKSEAYKAGYKTICDIGKERIRRAGVKVKDDLSLEITNIRNEIKHLNEKIKDENTSISPNNEKIQDYKDKIIELNDKEIFKKAILDNIDIGFRVLRLDSSNMKDVYYRPRDLRKDDLLSFSNNIKEDRTDLDLLFQVMPECGADFSSEIDELIISGKKVYKVGQNYIIACFDENINEVVIREIAKQKPVYAIFRDSSFQSDSVLANFEQIFKAEYPEVDFEENVKII